MVTTIRQLEHRSVSNGDHTTIHYTVSGPEASATLVLVHGWGCSRHDFEPITRELPDDLRVIAIDLAEFGDSRSTRDEFTMADFAHDVVAVLDAEDVQTCHAIGHSLGAAVVVEVARLVPSRVSEVVALDGLHYTYLFGALSEDAVAAVLEPLTADFQGFVRSVVESGAVDSTTADMTDAYVAKMSDARHPGADRALEGLLRWNMEEALAAINHPITTYAVRQLMDPAAVKTLGDRMTIVPVDLGSHHFGTEDPVGTARLLADHVQG